MADKVLDRRKFLRGLIAAPVAAVAAKAVIDAKYVPELKSAALDELIELEQTPEEKVRELQNLIAKMGVPSDKIMVAAPDKVFNPNMRVWRSVTDEAHAWASYLATKTGVDEQTLQRSCMTLARALDRDLVAAEVTQDQEIIVDLPQVKRTWVDARGRKQAEIAMGVEKVEVLGHERVRVGYIGSDAPPLVDHRGLATVSPEEHKARSDRITEYFQSAAAARRARMEAAEEQRHAPERKMAALEAERNRVREAEPSAPTESTWELTKKLFLG